ncbi:endonuclease MutS2 [Campylobacter geochelonis]|uniref:endonuclease MutS2 n=1 Tax=Campylobacter geochelonis TaxID=1780362 RepID=UPI00077076CB|nr:endonuclease MutS2 [Campylobacter geochelonis]CZE47485.1 recombination and DNA strand exchange inhibitor protein [Campylobacter geochelonis]
MKSSIFTKLDLDEYLNNFNLYLARQKPLFVEGDSKINYEKILELAKFDFKPCQSVANLDDSLMRVSKQGVLHISEIYEFSKIFNYFNYIKKIKFQGRLLEWLTKIVIPQNVGEVALYFDEKGEFKDSIDERFYALKEAYKIKKDEINSELKRLIYSKSITPYLVDTQIHYINDSEALLVRGGFNHVLKGTVVARSSGGYFYVMPANISRLKSEQASIMDKKEEIVHEHCKKISQIFSKNLLFLKFINQAFDQLDALCARAFLARAKDYEFVLADSSRDIIIKDFAHPALKNPKRVSIDFSKKVLLITGVNAGGKSMLLKSILTASLLSKYLLPMPIRSNESKIGTFKEFELIMEDPQSVKNDISTFAGRMLSFSKLFGRKNLIIGVDEIELGTDFEEAASLYSVLIKRLTQNDVKIIITTHHKRLAMLLAKDSEVELVAALYDENLGVPKFEFLKGTIGKSYAFETALRYGISPTFVSEAKKAYGEDKENLNEAISKAINLELKLREKLDETNKKEQKLDSLLEGFKNQKEKFEDEQKAVISRLETQYYHAISEAKRSVNLQDTKDKQRSINKANELVKAVIKPEIISKDENYKIGDRVKYEKIKGEIISLSKTDATILSDGIKLRVPIKLLKRSGNQPVIKTSSVSIKVAKPQSASVVLDLHGLRAEEAIEKLDKFISDSLVMGFDEVIVKHGMGTGKLAFAVKEFLKTHPSVVSFRDGTPNEGGFGSKIIKF